MILTRKNKDGKQVNYNIKACHIFDEDGKDYYSLTIPTKQAKENAGYLNFKYMRYGGTMIAWLIDVCVPEKYRGNGNGTALLEAYEYIAYSHHIRSLEGKFYPHDTNLSRDEMIEYYQKRGFSVDLYDKEISKYISLERVAKELAPRVSDYEIEDVYEHEM